MPRALDEETLQALALRYVERYATTRMKLLRYLARKLRERGWSEDAERPADLEALADRFVALGYVDDRLYGEAKARGLGARGYGRRRVEGALKAAGVAETLREEITLTLDAKTALLTLARRRRFGPFAREAPDRDVARKQFAAMVRAGHAPDLVARLMQFDDAEVLMAEWQDEDVDHF
ncbi:MAG: RecX family transcriptional regulator [Pseudomonadota bacterium]